MEQAAGIEKDTAVTGVRLLRSARNDRGGVAMTRHPPPAPSPSRGEGNKDGGEGLAVYCGCWGARNASDHASRRVLTCGWSSATAPAATTTTSRGAGSIRFAPPIASRASAT